MHIQRSHRAYHFPTPFHPLPYTMNLSTSLSTPLLYSVKKLASLVLVIMIDRTANTTSSSQGRCSCLCRGGDMEKDS